MNVNPEIVAIAYDDDGEIDIVSGGGFSNYFPRPAYQAGAVSLYLTETLGKTYTGLYNASGRAYPDVAAQGGPGMPTVWAGANSTSSGTSYSSPIFASVVALLNDRLLAQGRKPLGFLNPFLYANPGALNDITSGNNPGCNTTGFQAAKGWDPVTGLGTPNFSALALAAGIIL